MKKIIMLLMFLYTLTFGYDNVNTKSIVNHGKYLKMEIICDENTGCELADIERYKLLAIAKLKSRKSWLRILKKNNLKMKSIDFKGDKQIITFIICNSADSKLYDSSYGIEILYRKGK